MWIGVHELIQCFSCKTVVQPKGKTMKTLFIVLAIWKSTSIQVSGQKAPVRFVPIDSISTIPSGQKVKLAAVAP